MGFYVRTSRHTGIGMPWWLALIVLPIYWSMLACIGLCVWMFQFGVWLTVITVRLVQRSVEASQRRAGP